METADS
jgi:hypothetical protein